MKLQTAFQGHRAWCISSCSSHPVFGGEPTHDIQNTTTVLGTEGCSGDFGCRPDGNTFRAVRIRLQRRIFPQVRASPYQIDIECCAYYHPPPHFKLSKVGSQ